MKLRILCYVFLFVSSQLVPHSAHGAESPYKIRIGFPSLAFSYMPFYVAQEKGFDEIPVALAQRRLVFRQAARTAKDEQRLEHVRRVKRIDPRPFLSHAVIPRAFGGLMMQRVLNCPLCHLEVARIRSFGK